jgi:hypothetical protein
LLVDRVVVELELSSEDIVVLVRDDEVAVWRLAP